MKKKIIKIIFAVLIILFLIIQIYPVIWLFIASIKPTVELSTAPFAFPKSVTLENFASYGNFIDFNCGVERYSRLCVVEI